MASMCGNNNNNHHHMSMRHTAYKVTIGWKMLLILLGTFENATHACSPSATHVAGLISKLQAT